MEPEPTADQETHLKPATESETAASSIVEEESEVLADQVCEPAVTSVQVRVLVELEENDWLIDWSAESQPFLRPSALQFIQRLHLGTSSPALAWYGDSLALPRPSETSAPPQTIYQSAPPWLLAPMAPPETVIPSAPPSSLVPLAPPGLHRGTRSHLCHLGDLGPLASRLLLAITPPWSPCPSMSPGLSAHRTSTGTHYLPVSHQSVRLLPPSVPPWVILVLAASCYALDSRRRSTQPWILPSAPPWALPLPTPP
ncbi:vegetative cell wall gp1-like protein [Labeo rohita]|uniref:Vegetative cell wall gp1-like protein n=1 Tax=Labeo rohita TaxID=84645 RepID=A0A498MG63_LABRO|nr:vegetative cell wall gp1-like protein [Labeo rohita]RXN24514.1 vegetative cell wall gp1-like protein [Labeo rohita]